MKIRDCFYVNPSKNTNNHTDFINYIDTSSVTNGSLTSYDYLETDFPSRAQRLIKSDDILYSSVRPNLRHFYHYIDNFEHAVASTGFVLLRNKSNCNTKFVYYYLSTNEIVTHLSNIAELSQATFPSFSPKDLGKIDIPNYAVDKQQKIASILSAYDNLIEVNNKRIKVLEQMAENIYKEWFVRFRFPGHETTEFVNGLPKGWEKVKFSSKVNILSGGTPNTENSNYYNGNIPFFTPKDSDDGFFVYNTLISLTNEGLSHCNSKLYPENTIVITARGTVGNINLLAIPMAMNQSCYALSSELLSPYYLYFACKHEIKKLRKMASGGVFDTIIVKTFDHIQITVPKNDLLKTFEDKVESMMNQIKSISKLNQNLIKQRDLLLPRLMSGKLEV